MILSPMEKGYTSTEGSAHSNVDHRASSSSTTLTEGQLPNSSNENSKQSDTQPRSLSTDSEKQVSDNNPPNGGLQAWLQVVACHLLFLNSW